MFWFLFGVYTLCLSCVWGFFLLARLHALNFRDYSHFIPPMSRLLLLSLTVLTLAGYYLIFTYSEQPSVATDTVHSSDAKQEVY